MGEQEGQLALSFSDGSWSVFPPGWALDDVEEQRASDDKSENDKRHLTNVTRVRVELLETVSDYRMMGQPLPPDSALGAIATDDLRAELRKRGEHV